jgi:hypothetical protein
MNFKQIFVPLILKLNKKGFKKYRAVTHESQLWVALRVGFGAKWCSFSPENTVLYCKWVLL